MKKIVFFLALLPAFASCVGLEQYPTNSYTDETYWNYEDNVDAALYLGYNQCWSADLYWVNNHLSDDVYGSRHSKDNLEVATGQASTQNSRFSSEWNGCYQELRTIHTALDNLDRMNVSKQKKERYEAEWRLMRAFTYLRLITWFGDVPFFTSNPTNAQTLEATRKSAAQIRSFILEELEFAASHLPKNTALPAAERGRYTCGTAVAIKARTYLLNNDWAGCIRECERLIGSTEYGTYALAADYDELFKTGHYGPESIMTVEFAYEGGVEKIVRGWSMSRMLPQSIGANGIMEFSPTQELVNSFRKTNGSVAGDTDYSGRDKRFYTTIAYNGCSVEIPAAINAKVIGTQGVGKGSYTCWTDPKKAEAERQNDPALMDDYNGSQDRTATGYYTLKNFDPLTTGPGRNSYKSLIEIRYADVLLMYAESLYEKNGHLTADQWNATIRPLRERAGFDAAYCALPTSGVREAIRLERRCELALEGRRPFDLRRWALMDNPSLAETGDYYLVSTATGAPFMDDGTNIVCANSYAIKYWFPIPQSERDQNKNLTQNPGW